MEPLRTEEKIITLWLETLKLEISTSIVEWRLQVWFPRARVDIFLANLCLCFPKKLWFNTQNYAIMRLDLESIYVVIQTFFQKKRMISKNLPCFCFSPSWCHDFAYLAEEIIRNQSEWLLQVTRVIVTLWHKNSIR